MSLRMILAASAVLTFAAPAIAQDAPAAPPVAEAVDPAEAALEAKGEAFGARMQAMGEDSMQAAPRLARRARVRVRVLVPRSSGRYKRAIKRTVVLPNGTCLPP